MVRVHRRPPCSCASSFTRATCCCRKQRGWVAVDNCLITTAHQLDAMNTGHGVAMWFECAVAQHPQSLLAQPDRLFALLHPEFGRGLAAIEEVLRPLPGPGPDRRHSNFSWPSRGVGAGCTYR